MLNMRHFTDKFRAVATTSDLGSTWSEHPTSGSALIEPVCQASLLRVKSTVDGDDVDLLAFLNPKSQTARANMTLRLSDDEGMTWSRELVLYRKPCLGYSAMTKLDDETLGVLYETTGGLIFQRVKLSDVTTVE
jgi:sialidase-1